MEILKYIRPFICGACLWFSSEIVAQTQSSEDAYQLLDAFLAQPNAQNCNRFKSDLAQFKAADSNAQLAKVISLCNLGFYQQRYFNPTVAIASYEDANLIYHQHQLTGFDMINSCGIPLGNLYTQINALDEAENTIKAYILEAQKDKRTREEAAGLENLSIVFHNKGNFKQAIAVLQQGLNLEPNNQNIQLNLANNYFSSGEINISEAIVQKVLAKHPNQLKGIQLSAKIEIANNNHAKGILLLEKLLAILKNKQETTPRELAKLYVALAQSELVIKVPKKAENYLKETYKILVPDYGHNQEMPNKNQLFPESTFIDALDIHAQVYVQMKEYEKALQAYDLAFEASLLLSSTSYMQDSKLAYLTTHKNRSEASLNLLYDLHQKTKDTLWLHKALAIEQQAKSPVLRAAKQWQQKLLTIKDTILASNLKQIQLEVAQTGALLQQAGLQKTKNLQHIHRIQDQYTKAIEQQRSMIKKVEEEYPTLDVAASFASEILEQKITRKGNTVISYFIGKENIYQFLVTKQGVSFNRIAYSNKSVNVILQYIKEYNTFFEDASKITNDPSAYTKVAFNLYQALQIPKSEKLVIIPDGILSFVPFSSLLTEPSSSLSFIDTPFLIKETEISYAVSISEYFKKTERNHERKVLGIFPVFKGTVQELTHSLDEAAAIDKTTEALLLMDSEATTVNFLSQIDDFDILHISSHAQGGTFTQPAGIKFADKTLTIDELYGYQLNKELVVLSACETGVGKVIKGEGAQSMARAFQYTGATNVLFSLWKVNDLSTAQIMENFYKKFDHPNGKSHALHQAQLAYLNESQIDNTKKSPFYWAAFVYYGKVEIMTQDNNLRFLWIGVPLFLILGLWLLWRQQKKQNV